MRWVPAHALFLWNCEAQTSSWRSWIFIGTSNHQVLGEILPDKLVEEGDRLLHRDVPQQGGRRRWKDWEQIREVHQLEVSGFAVHRHQGDRLVGLGRSLLRRRHEALQPLRGWSLRLFRWCGPIHAIRIPHVRVALLGGARGTQAGGRCGKCHMETLQCTGEVLHHIGRRR